MSKFKTLKTKSTSLYKDRGSKFYAYAFPLNKIDKVKELLSEVQEEHPKARHICTALLLGEGDGEYFLTNDDGEPANSAGAPILGQIRSHELTNVFIAVVRYFGGTKLGISGLISAYKQSTAEAIANNDIVESERMDQLKLKVPYEQLGEILSIIDRNNLTVSINNQTRTADIILECPASEIKAMRAHFERYKELISES